MIVYNNLLLRTPRTVKWVQVHGANSKICIKQAELMCPHSVCSWSHSVCSWSMHTVCWMAKATINAKKKELYRVKSVSIHFQYEKYSTDYKWSYWYTFYVSQYLSTRNWKTCHSSNLIKHIQGQINLYEHKC